MTATIQFKTPFWRLNRLNFGYYDFLASCVNALVWRCPQSVIKEDYQRFVGKNHLEVGAKTGKMLDELNKPVGSFRLSLVDLNKASLQGAKNRLARYTPNIFELNISEGAETIPEKFDSIAINRVMHSIPKGFYTKGILFYHLKKMLKKDGVLFGSTIVSRGCNHNILSALLTTVFNWFGLLNNKDDSVAELERALKAYFRDVKLEVYGTTVAFSAR